MYLFTTKKHQDTHAHNFTMQFTELMYIFKDILPMDVVTSLNIITW